MYFSRYLYRRHENVCPLNELYADICSRIIHISPQILQMPISWWTDKIWHIHIMESYLGINGRKWYTEQYAWISKTCQMKETRHKRLHFVWLHLYKISRNGKAIIIHSNQNDILKMQISLYHFCLLKNLQWFSTGLKVNLNSLLWLIGPPSPSFSDSVFLITLQ